MQNESTTLDSKRGFSVDFIDRTGFKSPNMHCHKYSELLFVLKGNLNFLVDDEVYSSKGSCLIFFKEKQFHTTDVNGTVPYTRYNAVFRYKYLSDILDYEYVRELFEQDCTVIPLDEDEKQELLNICKPLYKYFSESDGDNNKLNMSRHLLCALLIKVNLLLSEKSSERTLPDDTYINRVLDYIKKHIAEKLTVADIAENFYISRSKLMSDFKAATGITIGDYILCNRIKLAKELLMSGNSVSDTAYLSGFVNTSHFIRTFKRETGLTPLQYCRSKI